MTYLEETHKATLEQMKVDNHRKMMSDNEKFAALMETKEKMAEDYERKIEQIQIQFQ